MTEHKSGFNKCYYSKAKVAQQLSDFLFGRGGAYSEVFHIFPPLSEVRLTDCMQKREILLCFQLPATGDRNSQEMFLPLHL